MADKVASLRLDLKSDTFKRGMKEAEAAAVSSASRMGAAFQNSMKGGLDAIRGLGSKLKSGLGLIAGPLAGIGVGVLVKDAMNAESQFRKLGFAIKTATGKQPNMEVLKKDLRGLAIETGIAVEDLITSFGGLSKVGGPEFAKEALKAVTNTSLATGASVEQLTEITKGLREQFGITGTEASQALALVSKTVAGSDIEVGELAAVFERVGAAAKASGVSGVEGIGMTLGMLDKAKESTGSMRKAVTGLSGLFDELGATVGRQKIYAKLGIKAKPDKDSALDAMQEIVKATGGDKKKLEKALTGPQLKLMTGLAEPYAKAYEATTGSVKEKMAAGIAAFGASIRKAGEASQLAADIEAEAARAKQEAGVKVAGALEEIKAAVAQPEVIAAFKSLAGTMPALAHVFTSTVPVIAKHLEALPAALATLTFAKGAFGAIGSAATTGGAAVATGAKTFSGSLLGAAGSTLLFAAAVASVTVAIDQAVKMIDEIGQQKTDIADEQKTLMENAERLGQTSVEYERKPSLMSGIAGAMLGVQPEGKKAYLHRDPKTGQIVSTDEPVATTGHGAEAGKHARALGAYGPATPSPEELEAQSTSEQLRRFALQATPNKAAELVAGKTDDPSKSAHAIASALGIRGGGVKITNLADLGAILRANNPYGPVKPGATEQ